jgi:hypothetical protein
MLGFVGGWDKRGLEHVKEAAEISGPSKKLTYFMYRTGKWAYDLSPLKVLGEKSRIPHEEADKEALELTLLRYSAQQDLIAKNSEKAV